MIRKANEITSKNKKIRILIAGFPGIGKSTLALSAPKPLHIDVDFGIDRIEPRYRTDFIQPKTYKEILADLTKENVSEYDTLVFDTGGKLVSLIGLWAANKNPKYTQKDGSLSLKGHGCVLQEFQRLMDYCFYELDKHIVMVFHAIEQKDNENIKLRIKVDGQTKNNVWEPMDLGGFMEMYGDNRTIGFSNCEKYFAKGTRGINGIIKIPELKENTPNDFLTKLFEQYTKKSEDEVSAAAAQQEAYEAAMAEGRDLLATITDAVTANVAMPKLKNIKHALTSELEINSAWKKKMKELDLFYDRVLKKYTPNPVEKPSKKTEDKCMQFKLEGSGQ